MLREAVVRRFRPRAAPHSLGLDPGAGPGQLSPSTCSPSPRGPCSGGSGTQHWVQPGGGGGGGRRLTFPFVRETQASYLGRQLRHGVWSRGVATTGPHSPPPAPHCAAWSPLGCTRPVGAWAGGSDGCGLGAAETLPVILDAAQLRAPRPEARDGQAALPVALAPLVTSLSPGPPLSVPFTQAPQGRRCCRREGTCPALHPQG